MSKNRDRLGIVAAIVAAANFEASKTSIMRQANLSFELLEKYMDIAVNAGLIQLKNGKYSSTVHGKNFCKEYTHFYERYNQAQRMLQSICLERERLAKLCNEYGLLEKAKTEINIA